MEGSTTRSERYSEFVDDEDSDSDDDWGKPLTIKYTPLREDDFIQDDDEGP